MYEISALILFTLIASLVIILIKNNDVRNLNVRISAAITAILTFDYE